MRHDDTDTLDGFRGSSLSVTADGGRLTLADGQSIPLGISTGDDLDDLWLGFSHGGREYDINVWSNKVFGGYDDDGWSACVYGTDCYGRIDTGFSVPVSTVEVEG